MAHVPGMAALGLGAALALACGGSPASPDHGASVFATSRASGSTCATFTGALCGYLTRCRGVPYCTADHCVADNDCAGFSALARALEAGAVTYDADAGGACLARFARDPCGFGALPQAPTIFDVLAQCPGALTPRQTRGAPCVASAECAAGLFCADANAGCSGVCAPFATAGQDCGGGAPCGAGLTCDAAARCRPSAIATAAGAACGATADAVTTCAAGLWCDANASDAQGRCQLPGGLGQPCNDFGGCEGLLHCASGQCLAPADGGGACETSTDCVAGLICDGGACAPPFDVGLRCRSDSYCKAGLTCATEKCLEARCPGDACDAPNDWCVLGVCKGGRCATRARAGEPCIGGGDCTSGTCTAGACAEGAACGA